MPLKKKLYTVARAECLGLCPSVTVTVRLLELLKKVLTRLWNSDESWIKIQSKALVERHQTSCPWRLRQCERMVVSCLFGKV